MIFQIKYNIVGFHSFLTLLWLIEMNLNLKYFKQFQTKAYLELKLFTVFSVFVLFCEAQRSKGDHSVDGEIVIIKWTSSRQRTLIKFHQTAEGKTETWAIQSYEINIMSKSSHKSSQSFRIKIIFLNILQTKLCFLVFLHFVLLLFPTQCTARCTFLCREYIRYWICFCWISFLVFQAKICKKLFVRVFSILILFFVWTTRKLCSTLSCRVRGLQHSKKKLKNVIFHSKNTFFWQSSLKLEGVSLLCSAIKGVTVNNSRTEKLFVLKMLAKVWRNAFCEKISTAGGLTHFFLTYKVLISESRTRMQQFSGEMKQLSERQSAW